MLIDLLAGYHDADFIIKGFTEGFRIGYIGTPVARTAKNNDSINLLQKEAEAKINNELSAGRIRGPFPSSPLNNFISSPLSITEKKEQNKFRLLHNLSYPYDATSVNANIPTSASSVKFSSVNDAINALKPLRTAFLAKTDIQNAFRLIPIHPNDQNLLGFSFKNQYYYDLCLPMGCSSSCQIFERFSDALLFIFKKSHPNASVIKYLDDFLFISPSFDQTLSYLSDFQSMCLQLGVPLAPNKTVLPTTNISFLGIQIDAVSRQLSIPQSKIDKYLAHLDQILKSKLTSKKDLQSLTGKLNFCSYILPAGRAFLRRTYDLTTIFPDDYPITITPETSKDLSIWRQFLLDFNSRYYKIDRPLWSPSYIHLYSDASKKGFGAVFKRDYLVGKFPPSWQNFSIQFLELYPIFLLVSIFFPALANQEIVFNCDNLPIVSIINKASSKDPLIMLLIRNMILKLINSNIIFRAIHIPGIDNVVTDALSRQGWSPGLASRFGLNPYPTPIPQHLLPSNFRTRC